VIHAAALGLLEANWGLVEERGITLFGVSIGNLHDEDAVQLALPFERSAAESLDTVVDSIRDRFGSTALKRATTMRGDPGFTVPMLPD
jgi:DNA polymerase-4